MTFYSCGYTIHCNSYGNITTYSHGYIPSSVIHMAVWPPYSYGCMTSLFIWLYDLLVHMAVWPPYSYGGMISFIWLYHLLHMTTYSYGYMTTYSYVYMATHLYGYMTWLHHLLHMAWLYSHLFQVIKDDSQSVIIVFITPQNQSAPSQMTVIKDNTLCF